MFELKNYTENIAHCIQCGFCQSVCPVFAEEKTAPAAARGKISLICALLEGELAVNDRFAGRVFNCLLCTSCVGTCPSGVKVDEIFLAARREVVRQKGLGWTKRAALHLWKDQSRLAAALRLFAGLNTAVSRLPLRRLAPWTGPFLESIPRGAFSRRVPAGTVPKARMRVGYFTGCATNLVYHSVGRSVLKVLGENGVEVVIPRGQQCCGLPSLIHGDTESARELIRLNTELFAGFEAVVCDCPSCSYILREKAPVLLADDPDGMAGQARRVSQKVWNVMEFLAAVDEGRSYPVRVPARVTYHVPCHLKLGPGPKKAARRLLGSVDGMELVEMEEPERCCGGGGSFFLTHGRTAARIREHKLADIENTGAGVVCTECPVCRMYLTRGLRLKGMSRQVVHPVELMALALHDQGALLAP